MIAKSTCQTFIYSGSGKGETNNRNNSDCDFNKIKGKKEQENSWGVSPEACFNSFVVECSYKPESLSS